MDNHPPVYPIRDQVLVKADPCENRVGKSKLLFAPQGEETWPNVGTVIRVGPGTWEKRDGEVVRVPLDVKPGDRVLFLRQPDSALVPDDREGDPDGWKDYVMLNCDRSIVGVVEEE